MHVSGYRTSFVKGRAQSMRRRYHLANCKPRRRNRVRARASRSGALEIGGKAPRRL
jgi:hypothetical protein